MTGWADAVRDIAATDTLLVALDFDGTLSHLSDRPLEVRALPESAAAVQRLSELPRTTVAFVSGRQLADLRVIGEHTDDSRIWLSGSHGAEHWRPEGVPPVAEDEPDPADGTLAAELVAAAEAAVDGIEGAWIEHKAYGFAVHTRLADDAGTSLANERVDALVAERAPGWRRRLAKDLIEYAWRHEGKDSAIARLRDETGATAVLFAGDDVTDEDALRSLRPGDLGVRVGDGETAAAVRVADPLELADLLIALADARAS
ncbi:trehalose-phosphatase [Microbacterium stercoris]|uniref:Trehalose 6-phosphate phosphatase n=1 Tax=Microbacterium stercoris TaxID=2820289 RepID=A0A939TLQ9_9MICO|nr:trehalose-phosphatase [Microbacterium stercoris]MBO3662383.1 trehalose-phosphatase [Microbacterium stercoris]MBO3664375.1 trehalose-phosphatase [Microbacterium stercoris]